MINIRIMVEADDVPVSRVVSECYEFIAGPDEITRSQLALLLAERCQPEHMAVHRRRLACHVAEVDGRVVGFIACSAGRIEELFVLPKHHRSGIATALFRKAESDCRHATLTVGTTGYGLPFYLAMGMRVTGKRLVTIGPLAGRQVTELERGVVRAGDPLCLLCE